jgi:uncharacterized membrane protein YdbT with pleckstrin-like domain
MELHARPHGAALVRPLGWAVLLAAAGGVVVVRGDEVHWGVPVVGAAVLALAALLAVAAIWRWERTTVVLTGGSLRVSWGLLRRHVAEVQLDRREPIEIEQSVTGRMLGFGTLVAGGLEVPYVPLHTQETA